VVDDALAGHAVGERLVERFNPQVVEEAGGPQPLEVSRSDCSVCSLNGIQTFSDGG
jgi:hypothetical protein